MVCMYNIDTWPVDTYIVWKIQIIPPNVVFYIITSYAPDTIFLVCKGTAQANLIVARNFAH